MQYRVHLLGDGHFYTARAGKADRGCCREGSFGNHAVHSLNDFGKPLAATEFDADAAVAGKASGAGEDEIAEAGESGHSFGVSSAGDNQAGHFRQPARDQGCHRVVPEAEAIADTCGNRDDIFQGTTEFYSDNITVGVDAERGVAECLLDAVQKLFVLRCDGDRGGIPSGDFLREGWTA